MFRPLLISAALVFAAPAIAQNSQGDHAHDHGSATHAGHGSDTTYTDTTLTAKSDLRLASQPELTAALAAGGEPVVAKVLGAVCDFCAKAMNKTFGKRDDVAAVYVDLDDKTLNLVLKPGESVSDAEIKKAVKKAGYRVERIARGAAVTAP